MLNKQKIAVIVPDGMADSEIPSLGSKTPMEAALKPNMDRLARSGVCGMVKTITEDMTHDASATANLAILGYDPNVYYTGRSPLEAVNIGLAMRERDVAIRCNLVTLTGDGDIYEHKVIADHSADEITTEEAGVLIHALDKALGDDKRRFHTGVSYRHCLLWEDCPGGRSFTPPHDILNKCIKDYLPAAEYSELMRASFDILDSHPINMKRREDGKKPANSIWFWSAGTKPDLPSFKSKYGFDGSVIAAVDLIKGIGVCAGMKTVNVDGATGNFHTSYKNKGLAAIDEFENGADFVYIHIEAPDECGHRGETENKVASIEKIDAMIVGPVYDYLKANCPEFKILILPDHPTPLSIRTHSSGAVPFSLYKSGADNRSGIDNFNEKTAAEKSEIYIRDGYKLMEFVLGV